MPKSMMWATGGAVAGLLLVSQFDTSIKGLFAAAIGGGWFAFLLHGFLNPVKRRDPDRY